MSDIPVSSPPESAELESAAGDRMTRALGAIMAAQPELFIDFTGKPMICLPLTACASDRTPHRLRGDRARASLFATVSRDARFVPFQEEINRILWILEDLAWKDVRMEAAYSAAIEQSDLIDALDILANSVEGIVVYHGTCSGLRDRLNDIAVANGIDVRHDLWPKGASRLSQRLWELRNLLRSGGILIERGRSNGPRWIKLSCIVTDGDLAAASLACPHANSLSSTMLRSDDDSDGSIAALLRNIEAPSIEKDL